MSNTERNTHFAGFARCIVQKLPEFPNPLGYTVREWREEATTMLAQYAYDFALHILREHSPAKMDMCPEYEWLDGIPDMPALPEVQA